MIVNINYSGQLCGSTKHLKFRKFKPIQFIEKCDDYTIIIFKSGKCRIMGCKKKLCYLKPLRFKIENIKVQSVTVVEKLNQILNLHKLSVMLDCDAMYEPELFPALRFLKFNPMCVNIFSTGKVIILGIRVDDCENIVSDIMNTILIYVDMLMW